MMNTVESVNATSSNHNTPVASNDDKTVTQEIEKDKKEEEKEEKIAGIDTSLENSHTPINGNENATDNNTISPDVLPEKLNLVPVEHEAPLTKSDLEYIAALCQQFKEKLTTTFAHQPDLVPRFVLGYRHEKPKKRMAITAGYLQKYMETYEQLKLNEIVTAPITEDEQKAIKGWEVYVYGTDKMGHPIMYDHLGALDLVSLQEVYARNPNIIKFSKYRFMTKLTNLKSYLSHKYGKLIYKHVMIFDMHGFTKRFMGTTTRKICKEIIGDLTHMYPEMAYKVFVINAPSVFKNCWKIVKTFMEPVTVDKVKVFGTSDVKEFYKEFNMIADADMIPLAFGGKGKFTVRLSDVPLEYTMDLTKPYPYELPQFPIKEEEKKASKK